MASSEALEDISALTPELWEVARWGKVFIYGSLEVSGHGCMVAEDCPFVDWSLWG